MLEHVKEDTSVQINFHMDSPLAMADSKKSFAATIDSRANIGIYSDRRLKPSLVPAKISTRNDVWHDTMIARFEAEHLAEGRHAFLSVAYPVPEGQKLHEVTDIASELLDDGKVRFGFSVDHSHYELELADKTISLHSEKEQGAE